MSTYTPDRWAIVQVNYDGEEMHRILGGWSGGYLGGDSWRLGSPIKEIVKETDHIKFINESGSNYVCYFAGEGFNMVMMGAYKNFKDADDAISVKTLTLEEYLKLKE